MVSISKEKIINICMYISIASIFIDAVYSGFRRIPFFQEHTFVAIFVLLIIALMRKMIRENRL